MDTKEIKASASQIDPDDDRRKGVWFPVVLRFSLRRMTMVVQAEAGKRSYDAERRFLRFRGPRIVQCLLTPLFAPFGMLFSLRDCRWNDSDQAQPVMELRPCVPQDFWFAFRFANQTDAEEASRLLAGFF